MFKYWHDGEYITIERGTLRIIRQYFLHYTKKAVAEIIGVSQSTMRRIEKPNCHIRKSTYEKIVLFYHQALIQLGWELERPQHV